MLRNIACSHRAAGSYCLELKVRAHTAMLDSDLADNETAALQIRVFVSSPPGFREIPRKRALL